MKSGENCAVSEKKTFYNPLKSRKVNPDIRTRDYSNKMAKYVYNKINISERSILSSLIF